MALNVSMGVGQYIIVRVTDDGRNFTAWVQDQNAELNFSNGMPVEPVQAVNNRTTSASTMGTNVQNALPTLTS